MGSGLTRSSIKQCDFCKAARSDETLGWFTVERDLLVVGQWERLDFCSPECLQRYFQDHTALQVAMGWGRG